MSLIVCETERLIVPRFEAGDGDVLYRIVSHSLVMRFHHKGALSREEADAMLARFLARYERNGTGPYPLIRRSDQQVVGHAARHPFLPPRA